MREYDNFTLNRKPLLMGSLVAVYGTLKAGFGNHFRCGMTTQAELVDTDTIPGVLLHLGGFPGFVPEMDGEEPGPVTVEVYRLLDNEIGRRLDQLEGYDPNRDDNGFYTRRTTTTHKGYEVDTYVYERLSNTYPRISSGCYA